jgi:hypothetical protein
MLQSCILSSLPTYCIAYLVDTNVEVARTAVLSTNMLNACFVETHQSLIICLVGTDETKITL